MALGVLVGPVGRAVLVVLEGQLDYQDLVHLNHQQMPVLVSELVP